MFSVQEVIKRWIYAHLSDQLRGALGLRLHYRAQYQEYLQGPRWYVIRHARLWWDGRRCVVCGKRTGLEMHHLTYDHKDRGVGIMEFLTIRTVCEEHHDWAHGK